MLIWRSPSKAGSEGGFSADPSSLEIDTWQLLGAYAFGTLSVAEERRLHSAALIDQDLFNALADEDLLRTALEDEAFHKRLKERLLDRSERFPAHALLRVRDWLGRPTAALAIGAVALVIVLSTGALLFLPETGNPGTASEYSGRPIQAKGLLSPPPAPPLVGWDESASSLEFLWNSADPTWSDGVQLTLDQSGDPPQYAAGEAVRIGFSVRRDVTVVLLAKNPEGAVTRLFPNGPEPWIQVRANEKIAVTHIERDESRLAGSIGRHDLRLLVLPVGIDPVQAVTNETSWKLAVEQGFEVLSPLWGSD